MKKDDFKKPIVAENPTDTVVVNVGEEITDNAVQKEEVVAPDEAQNVVDSENTDILEQSEDINTVDNGEVSEGDAEQLKDETNNSDEAAFEEESTEERTGRTLSPGRLVLKRFFRSKLSMTGLVLLIALFIFSFFGPLFDFLPFIWGEKEADNSSSVREESTSEVKIDYDGEYSVFDDSIDGSNKVYIVTFSYPSNYLKPSGKHLLGTDDKGYDVLSRLMYGGRISLTIGFVVIILETVIGVILGGIAGYFGKWVDQIIMRIVDVFNCIPTFPMLMIVGVALQQQGMADVPRLYTMMAMLTLFGWSGTARLVRGQILSLREQEFMVAAEATGVRVSRRIFRHLVPNVVPQLIVFATMDLGAVILAEATLSFLGLGIKYPAASWGSIINAVNDSYVMTNFLFVWVPAGILILLTVLAFNFIGDGLRDAFDPKMKR